MLRTSRVLGAVRVMSSQYSRAFATIGLKDFASIEGVTADAWNHDRPHTVKNFVSGEWRDTAYQEKIVDPLTGRDFMYVPDTTVEECKPFISNIDETPKYGLHNPLFNVDRYLMLGRVSDRTSAALRTPEVEDFFARLIQRVSPKSYAQAVGEVRISAQFLDNFSGDQVRYLARGFSVPGDHRGQQSNGYRFPFGAVSIITPFNFPLEIPLLQLMGALYMGNRPLVKVDSKTAIVMEQYLRLLHAAGLPASDVDFVNCNGLVMNRLLTKAKNLRMTLFTGSSQVAERLVRDLHGKVKIEDAGFDWKILGPDVSNKEYVAFVSDQDAYACSGQKCSAQSMLFAHKNWVKAGLFEDLKNLAAKRNLKDLTIGPVLTWTTEKIKAHIAELLTIPGAKLLFGGEELPDHTIPKRYGAIQPTAVFVPLSQMMKKRYFDLVTTEVFGPMQVVTEYSTRQIDQVIEACNRMQHHLTAAVVSNDVIFRNDVLSRTVNGTTYVGIRARTTGAPQNHWFGPSGDPRGAGIGTREAIQLVWSSHREIISDDGPLGPNFVLPAQS